MFEMNESDFFAYYTATDTKVDSSYHKSCHELYEKLIQRMPELPFSNVWIASKTANRLPESSCLHLGILNSTRTWNLFELPKSVTSYANVGGFGIDGGVSSLIGASFMNPGKLYFGVVGDLAFFYDMNSLGNRHIGNNLRLMVVNNGKGTEFKNFYHVGSTFGNEADKFIAAGGHFGNKSPLLLKHYAEDLGFEYISASNKEEYLAIYERFISPTPSSKPIVFEVFTKDKDESDAIEAMWNIDSNTQGVSSEKIVTIGQVIRKIIGRNGIEFIKLIIGRK